MKRRLKRIVTALIGSVVIIIGIILIPYPGPGWVVVFAGLGILATEYAWAQRVLEFAKGKYDAWTQWVAKQNVFLKSLIWLVTALVVVVTVWLVNGYGVINSLFHLNQAWLKSPLPFFK